MSKTTIRSTGLGNVSMDMGGPKPVVRKQDIEGIFAKEKARVESNMFDPDFADNVIGKFRKFLDKLDAKEDRAIEEENEGQRSEISIAKLDIASRLVEAFGEKAKVVEKAKAPEAFDEDLLAMLGSMKL